MRNDVFLINGKSLKLSINRHSWCGGYQPHLAGAVADQLECDLVRVGENSEGAPPAGHHLAAAVDQQLPAVGQELLVQLTVTRAHLLDIESYEKSCGDVAHESASIDTNHLKHFLKQSFSTMENWI